ncbi:MAG TPA: hypothetical protein VLM76_13495 [Patescibacteria group bacterium]|nr:hypothetical protein [Patescibacteria group bacterium]
MTEPTKQRPFAEFAGRSNSLDILTGLPGERIAGAFEDTDGSLVLIMESGYALVLVTLGGGTPAFWVESASKWGVRLAAIRKRIAEDRDALAALIEAAP